jgi:hypothetical protein
VLSTQLCSLDKNSNAEIEVNFVLDSGEMVQPFTAEENSEAELGSELCYAVVAHRVVDLPERTGVEIAVRIRVVH